jgi:DNA-binding NarL/FixJ family response regulator
MSTTLSLAPLTPDQSRAAGPISVVIADAEPQARAGLSALLAHEPGITVAGEATTCDEVVALVHDAFPDVVLLDADLPGDCVRATRAVLADAPVTVVVMAATEMDSRVFAAMRAGAARRLIKGPDPTRLVRAVRQCAWSTRHRPRHARAPRHFMTPDVVELVPRGGR